MLGELVQLALPLQKLTPLGVDSVAVLEPVVVQDMELNLSEVVPGICVHVLKS